MLCAVLWCFLCPLITCNSFVVVGGGGVLSNISTELMFEFDRYKAKDLHVGLVAGL